ncbi:MAG: HEAT repeat domain-containing protein [Blastocatellales bacterium]|nr:HEAT repeat domain-containing protein [Blastocatellales bacterium]
MIRFRLLLKRSLFIPALALLGGAACAQAPPSSFTPRVEPLYERCASLDGVSGANEKVEAAIASLKSGDVSSRKNAAETLARACDRRAVEPLVASAKSDTDTGVRVAAIEALGRLGDREAIDPLLELIDDPDWRVRLPLSRTLCSFQVDRASYDVLNRLVNPASMQIESEGDLYARCQGILMICQLREEAFSRKAVLFAISLLDLSASEHKRMVEATMYELGKTRNGRYQFVTALDQSLNPNVRLRAAYWIGELGIDIADESLKRAAAEDRDPRVRQAATEALAKLKKEEK